MAFSTSIELIVVIKCISSTSFVNQINILNRCEKRKRRLHNSLVVLSSNVENQEENRSKDIFQSYFNRKDETVCLFDKWYKPRRKFAFSSCSSNLLYDLL